MPGVDVIIKVEGGMKGNIILQGQIDKINTRTYI